MSKFHDAFVSKMTANLAKLKNTFKGNKFTSGEMVRTGLVKVNSDAFTYLNPLIRVKSVKMVHRGKSINDPTLFCLTGKEFKLLPQRKRKALQMTQVSGENLHLSQASITPQTSVSPQVSVASPAAIREKIIAAYYSECAKNLTALTDPSQRKNYFDDMQAFAPVGA
jgi:hypothetical protein